MAAERVGVKRLQGIGHTHQQHALLFIPRHLPTNSELTRLAAGEQLDRQSFALGAAEQRRVAAVRVDFSIQRLHPNRRFIFLLAVQQPPMGRGVFWPFDPRRASPCIIYLCKSK